MEHLIDSALCGYCRQPTLRIFSLQMTGQLPCTSETSGTKFLCPNASTGHRDTGRSARALWTPAPLLAFQCHFPADSGCSSGAQWRRTTPWRTRTTVCIHNCQFTFAGAQVFRCLKGKLYSFLISRYHKNHR